MLVGKKTKKNEICLEIYIAGSKEMRIVVADSAESPHSTYYLVVDDLRCVVTYLLPHDKSVKKSRNYYHYLFFNL